MNTVYRNSLLLRTVRAVNIIVTSVQYVAHGIFECFLKVVEQYTAVNAVQYTLVG
jgi:hypothetical protein